MAAAMARIHLRPGQPIPAGWPCGTRRTCIPPEAQIDAPDWFSPIDVARVPASGLEIRGRAAAPHEGDVGAWRVQYACGQDATDSSFQNIPGASGTGPVNGVLGTLSKSLLTSLADNCNGEVANDAGRPAGAAADGAWPADPYPNPDPERHAFQIRLTVHEAAHPANIGRYRKTLFAYRDDGNLAGLAEADRPRGLRRRARHGIGRRDLAPPLRRRRRQRARRPAGDLERRALRASPRRHPGAELQRRAAGEDRPDRAGAGPSDRRLAAEAARIASGPGDRRHQPRSRLGDRRHRGRARVRLEPGRLTRRRASPCASTRRSPIPAIRALPIPASTPPTVTSRSTIT